MEWREKNYECVSKQVFFDQLLIFLLVTVEWLCIVWVIFISHRYKSRTFEFSSFNFLFYCKNTNKPKVKMQQKLQKCNWTQNSWKKWNLCQRRFQKCVKDKYHFGTNFKKNLNKKSRTICVIFIYLFIIFMRARRHCFLLFLLLKRMKIENEWKVQ